MQGISDTYSIGILRILLDSDSQFRIIGNSHSDTLSCTFSVPVACAVHGGQKFPSRQYCTDGLCRLEAGVMAASTQLIIFSTLLQTLISAAYAVAAVPQPESYR